MDVKLFSPLLTLWKSENLNIINLQRLSHPVFFKPNCWSSRDARRYGMKSRVWKGISTAANLESWHVCFCFP